MHRRFLEVLYFMPSALPLKEPAGLHRSAACVHWHGVVSAIITPSTNQSYCTRTPFVKNLE